MISFHKLSLVTKGGGSANTSSSAFKYLVNIIVFVLFLFSLLSSEFLSPRLLTTYEFIFLLGIVSLIAFGIFNSLAKKYLVLSLVVLPALLFVSLRILPTFFSPILNPHSAISKTGGLIMGLLFFLSLYQFELSRRDKDKILLIIFISGVLQSLIGTAQYLLPSLDLSPFLMKFNGAAYGSFQQVNLFATWLATCIVLSLYLITIRWFAHLIPVTKILFFLSLFSVGFALSLTGSRIGLLGVVFGSMIFIFSRWRHLKSKRKLFSLWVITVVIAITAGIICEKVNKGNVPLISKTEEVLRGNFSGRDTLYKTALSMFSDSPLGTGIGDFGSLYPFYEQKVFKKENINSPRLGYASHPHNETLYILVESGILGIIGLIGLTIAFVHLFRRLGFEKGGLYLSLLTPLLIHIQFEYPLYQSLPHWTLFLILLYLPSSHQTKTMLLNFTPSLTKVTRIFILTISLLTIIFTLATFKDYLKIIKHVKLINEKGIVDIALLESAAKNPYLKEEAERFEMQAFLAYGLRENDRDILSMVVEWSEKQRKITPLPSIYATEIQALIGIGRIKEAIKLLDEAVSIFPSFAEIF